MSTLGEMKARIAREIYRDDLDDAIAAEIDSAIRFYQSKRVYFQERYTFTFDTEVGKALYGSETATELGNLISIDFVNVTDNGFVTTMQWSPPGKLDVWAYPPSNGTPYLYTYYESALRVYPTPSRVLPIRVAGVIPYPAPSDDAEDNNPWMYDAEELIRSRAKRNIYLHSLGDREMAQAMQAAEAEALNSLQSETATRAGVDSFAPFCL